MYETEEEIDTRCSEVVREVSREKYMKKRKKLKEFLQKKRKWKETKGTEAQIAL